MAQDRGHERSASQTDVPGPWQLYSTATGLDLAIYADFATCRQAAVTGPDMSCKPAKIVLPDAPTPPIVQPPIVTTPTMNSAFRIDASNLAKGSAGDAYDRLQYTGEPSMPSDIGQFRIPCAYSHMAFDDPIVYPGRPGAAHLHTFFGNTGTNASSTEQSIRDTGSSTCLGGTINRTAYWVPSMIDTATGKPIVPDFAVFYYKQGYTLAPSSAIQPMPAGLRMIAGDPTSSKPGSPGTRFKCIAGPNNSNDQYGSEIPNCDVGALLYQEIFFPQCWDGRNLDAPDHKSHMSYRRAGQRRLRMSVDASGGAAPGHVQHRLHGADEGRAESLATFLGHLRHQPSRRVLVARRLVQRLEEGCLGQLERRLRAGEQGLPCAPARRRPDDVLIARSRA